MRILNGWQPALAALALMGFASLSYAASITVPPGLNPGDTYRLIFVTSATFSSSSTSITDYDAFVNSAANAVGSDLASLEQTWQVIGSTATVNAIDHIGGSFSTPVYRLDGLEVASGSSDLWDGTIDRSVSLNEFGQTVSANITSGSTSAGIGKASHQLGTSFAEVGSAGLASGGWIASGVPEVSVTNEFYGISGIITVGAQTGVPEPGTVILLIAGLVFIAVKADYRHRDTVARVL